MNPYYYGTAQNVGVPNPYNYGSYQPMPNYQYMNNNYQSQNQQVQQQNQNTQAPVQQVFLPLTNVNSVEEVNRFIVPINQSVYFRLNNDNKIYLKSTDIKGVSTIEEFDLISNKTAKSQETKTNQSVEYATKQDFNELVGALAEFRKTILSEMKTLLNEPKNSFEKEVINDAK